MKTRSIILWIAVIAVVGGCSHKKQQEQKPEENKVEVSQAVQAPAIAEEEQYQEDAPGVWHKISDDAERCFAVGGCYVEERRVLAGVVKTAEGLKCGQSAERGIDYVPGYRCSARAGFAACAQESCQCADAVIKRGELCDGAVADGHFDSASVKYEVVSNDAETAQEASPEVVPDEAVPVVDEQAEMFAEFTKIAIRNSYGYVSKDAYFCLKDGGCTAKDGRHFGPLSNSTDCAYIIGDKDTTASTDLECETGTCVLPSDVDPSLKMVRKAVVNDFFPAGYHRVELEQIDRSEGHLERYEIDAKFWVEGFEVDAELCEGGVRYCHGAKNEPTPMPAKSEGYRCSDVYYVPGATDSSHSDLKVNAFDVSFDVNRELRSWKCEQEKGCICGGGLCPENGVCVNEHCYCGSREIKPGDQYVCSISDAVEGLSEDGEDFYMIFMSSPCKGKRCSCGTTSCPLETECVDGECLCRGFEKPSKDSWRCVHPEGMLPGLGSNWRCAQKKGCMVGDLRVPLNAMVSDGKVTCSSSSDIMPGNRYECSEMEEPGSGEFTWICTGKEPCLCYGETIDPGQQCDVEVTGSSCSEPRVLTQDGCFCGDQPAINRDDYECVARTNQQPVNVCYSEQGCLCGVSRCKIGYYCIEGSCIEPKISDGAAYEEYEREHVEDNAERAVFCDDEAGCFCGAQKCPHQSYCLDDVCIPGAYSFMRSGHRFSYEYDHDDVEDASKLNEMSDQLQDMISGRWITCDGEKKITPELFDFESSDRIDDYVCDVCIRESDVEDEYVDEMQVSFGGCGLRCNNPDYCMCGDVRCGKDSQCTCEIENERLKCSCSDVNGVKVYPDHSLKCGDSRIPKRQAAAYRCDGDFGFVCDKNAGCACGSAVCMKGAVCLSADVCTESVELRKKVE